MNSKQVANILAFYSYYHPQETIDEIALDFKIPAANIINGLYYGQNHKLFAVTKNGPQFKEINVLKEPKKESDYGADIDRVKSNIYEAVTNLNSDEEDITDDNLFIWLGVPFTVSKVALQLLVNERKLARYNLVDSKDKSKYTFYTLFENIEQHYGKKQFKRKATKKDEQLSSDK